MAQQARDTYEEIRETTARSEDVLGFVLGGSRGRGFETEHSDFDCALIVKDEALEEFQARFADLPDGIDLTIFTLDSFRDHAAWGSELAWDRYAWAHLKAELDKTNGEIQRLIDEKSRVPAEHAWRYIDGSLDWYVNQVYRSIKDLRVGDLVSHRLEAAESIRPLLQALFCLHDRRLVPYYKYLGWELTRYPLYKLSLSGDELLRRLLSILEDGDYAAQQELLREVERVFRAEGFHRVFDDWDGKDRWAMTFAPEQDRRTLNEPKR